MTPIRSLLLAPLAALAFGDARPVDVDKAHSSITFVAPSRMLDARGSFERWDADVALDPADFAKSRVRLTIDAASINTGIDRRDNHLRGEDFFDVAKYPTITFVSHAVVPQSANAGVISGDLSMHGVSRQLQVPVSVVRYADGRGEFKGAFKIARRDYGLSFDSRMNPIADTIRVQFTMSVAERK